MYITKVRITKKGTEIHYEEYNANGAAETQVLKSEDKAMPSFYKALENLKPHFLTLLDLPEGWGKGMTMVGLVATYKDGMEFSMMAENPFWDLKKGYCYALPKGCSRVRQRKHLSGLAPRLKPMFGASGRNR